MESNMLKSLTLVVASFAAGVLITNLPRANATPVITSSNDLTHKNFVVSIDEVKKNFVFADEFNGHYSKNVTLSDGTKRTIDLVPMLHDGMQVVEFKDTGGVSYMGLNGTTTNGKLMVHIYDLDNMHAQLKREGWAPPVGR